MNLARCKQINRSINAHFVLTPIRYQQLHIYKCVCVSVCSLWHTWLAECAHSGGARDFRCMLPQDTERYEYSMRSQKKRLYVSKTTNAEATHKQHSCQSTHHLQQQQPTTAATTTTVQLRFMLCPLLRRWFMNVCLFCTVWSKHWFTRGTLGRQPDVHFSTTLRHCACAQHVNWECAALCACVSLVCIGVCLWFQLLWLLYL